MSAISKLRNGKRRVLAKDQAKIIPKNNDRTVDNPAWKNVKSAVFNILPSEIIDAVCAIPALGYKASCTRMTIATVINKVATTTPAIVTGRKGELPIAVMAELFLSLISNG